MADLGGVGDVLKTVLVGLAQVTPEGRAIVQADRERRAKMDALRFKAIEDNPALLQLADHSAFYDSVLGAGASKIRKQEFERGQAMEALFGQAFAGQSGAAMPVMPASDPFEPLRQGTASGMQRGPAPQGVVRVLSGGLTEAPLSPSSPPSATPTSGPAPSGGNPYAGIVASAARKYGLDPMLIAAVMTQESGGNPRAVSPKGAQGLMQLMPGTAKELGVTDPFDPVQNIHGGAQYLRKMLDMFGGDERLALAAYNAGPGRVRDAGGIPNIPETQDYVRRVDSLRGGEAPPSPAMPRPQLPPVNTGGLQPGMSLSMRRGPFSASISGVAPEQRKQQQYDADLAAVLPTYLEAFNGDALAAEEAAIAQIAAERGPNALPAEAYKVFTKRRRVGESAEKAAAAAEEKAQFTPTEQQDAAQILFGTSKYGALTNRQKADVDTFLKGRKFAETQATRAAEVEARRQFPASREDELLSLPTTPTGDGTAVQTRADARKQQEIELAEAKADIPARASGSERAYLRQAVSMTKAIERVGALFDKGGSALTGLQGIAARTMGDYLGTNTTAQTQFKQTNQMVENVLVYMTTGKTINEQEAKRIKATVTDVSLAPSAWQARFHGLVRFTAEQLEADADIMETDRLRTAGIPRAAAARLRAQFPDAFTVEPDAVRDKALAQGDTPATDAPIAVPGFPGFTIGGE